MSLSPTLSKYAVNYVGSPGSAAAKLKTLTGDGPLNIAKEHLVATTAVNKTLALGIYLGKGPWVQSIQNMWDMHMKLAPPYPWV